MDLSRGLNRKSYYEIEASPLKHRPTPDHQSLRYHKTAKFQQSTRAETINHRQAIRPKHPNHGPNRKMSTENQSSPYEHHSEAHHPPHRKSAESQQSAGRTSTNHQPAKHTTARTRRPDRRTHTEIGSSPYRHRQTPDHQSLRCHKIAKFQQFTRTETINHRQATRPKHPNHGPNQRTNAENRPSPYEHYPEVNRPLHWLVGPAPRGPVAECGMAESPCHP